MSLNDLPEGWTRTTLGYGTDSAITVDVPPGYALVNREYHNKLVEAVTLLSDLDRSPHGRHKGDVECQDPSGYSQGNPYLTPGQRIGTDLSGNPITVPDVDGRADLRDPDLWRTHARIPTGA